MPEDAVHLQKMWMQSMGTSLLRVYKIGCTRTHCLHFLPKIHVKLVKHNSHCCTANKIKLALLAIYSFHSFPNIPFTACYILLAQTCKYCLHRLAEYYLHRLAKYYLHRLVKHCVHCLLNITCTDLLNITCTAC